MNDHAEGVMIALLPITSEWCQIKLPHMTLVYCGKTSELPAGTFDAIVKDTSALAAISRAPMLRVKGVEQMGDDSDRVDVLRLQITPELAAMRRFVEKWNKSEYTEFKPHCTIGMANRSYVNVDLPRYLAFDKMCVQWGDDMVAFNLAR